MPYTRQQIGYSESENCTDVEILRDMHSYQNISQGP